MKIRLHIALLASLLTCAAANAQVTLTQLPTTERYTAGATLDITVTLNVVTADQINAVGLEQTLPAGWTFDSAVSGDIPGVLPTVGEDGLLEFAWFPLPVAYPVSFVYRVAVPLAATGTQSITGTALVLLDVAGEVTATASTVLPREGDGPFHTADTNLSGSLSLGEILRLIQFYNIGGFHCADTPEATEDGYEPGLLGSKACTFHQSDYAPQSWTLSLAEILRAIQFYNSLALYACPDADPATEDGFCPGFPP